MSVHLALLRGVNVGGNNLLPMRALKAIFERAGGRDVETHIQSGNVIFAAESAPEAVAARAGAAIERDFGFKPAILCRSAARLQAILAGNPFASGGDAAAKLYVMCLAKAPSAERLAALDPLRSAPDAFAVRGAEVYLSLANGAGRTLLTNAWFNKALDTVSTMRNWRVMTRLAALAAARG